jgi:hypothetical protein
MEQFRLSNKQGNRFFLEHVQRTKSTARKKQKSRNSYLENKISVEKCTRVWVIIHESVCFFLA